MDLGLVGYNVLNGTIIGGCFALLANGFIEKVAPGKKWAVFLVGAVGGTAVGLAMTYTQ